MTLWLAMLTPALLVLLAVAAELVHWSVVQIKVQRAADISAIAGAINFKATGNAQSAATVAARMAQLNGGTGTASPTWDAASKTLTDNMITAQVTAGVQDAAQTAVKVTVRQAVSKSISSSFTAGSSVTLTGTGYAELVASGAGSSGPQPCLVALSATGYISGAGSTYLNMPNCSVVSNNTIDVHGGGSLTTAGLYAANAINIDPWIPAAGQHPNNGAIPDPYANHTALQAALTAAAAATGSNIACSNQTCTGLPSGTCTGSKSIVCNMIPGNYGSFLVTSGGPYRFNLAPGKYVFNGEVRLTNNTTTVGTNVTILTTGKFTGSNTFNFLVSAPNEAAVATTGGVAGVVLAGTSSLGVVLSGSVNFGVSGAVYFPNALFDSSGSNGLGSVNTTCLEVLAASIKVSGYSYFNSSCASLNVLAFGSVPGTIVYTARLVK
ncbi:MAG: hypothetical protein AB7O80_25930 [Acetobacteraceae bacterium]